MKMTGGRVLGRGREGSPEKGNTSMDELGLNKVFAAFLVAALMLMAGIKLADVLVPHSELQQNAYIIEVPEGGSDAAADVARRGRRGCSTMLAMSS